MKISQNGINLIKKFEGLRVDAYLCPAGIWTIGYGHTAGVQKGQTISAAQAEAYLRADLEKYERKVGKYDTYAWNQNEFDALVSFAFNIGNIDQLTANGTRDRETIAEKMLLYNKAGGKVLAGLVRRRKDEQGLFLTPCGADGQAGHVIEYSLQKDGNMQISSNFKVKEFRCKDGSDRILIDETFVKDKLQAIRDHFGMPVTINSAYRTKSYNEKVKGAKSSYHLKGKAFDIVVKGHSPLEVAQFAQSLNINGIIQYNTFVHIDSRDKRYWARDDNGKITVKSRF